MTLINIENGGKLFLNRDLVKRNKFLINQLGLFIRGKLLLALLFSFDEKIHYEYF
jgi:hypothetical protein